MSKISELTDGGSLLPTDFLIAVRSGANVKVQADQADFDRIRLGDNEKIELGNSQDLTLVHTATQSIINQAGTGDLLIQKAGTTKASITANGLEFPDNSKAIFGAGSDLKIYHDGSNSFIQESGTGDLKIRSNKIRMEAPDSQNMIIVTEDAGVQAFYNGTERLSVTNTGIDVTGSVTADGLTSSGTIKIDSATPALWFYENDATNLNGFIRNVAGDLLIQTINDAGSAVNTRMSIDHSTGDISFYEDTGTTPKLFWDASAESLGIGTDPSSYGNTVVADQGGNYTGLNDQAAILVRASSGTSGSGEHHGAISFSKGTGQAAISGVQEATDADVLGLAFWTHESTTGTDAAVERMRIDSSGNVGIGTTPNTRFHVSSTTTTKSVVETTGTTSDALIEFTKGQGSGNTWSMGIDHSNSSAFSLAYLSNGSPSLTSHGLLTVDTSGNVGIGTESPSSKLTVGAANTINTKKATVQITDTSAGASLALRGQAPALIFDATAGGVPKILMDSQGVEFKDGTIDSEGSVVVKIDASGHLLVGTTSQIDVGKVCIDAGTGSNGLVVDVDDATGYTNLLLDRTASDGTFISFNRGATNVGSIGSLSGAVTEIVLDPRTNGASLTGGTNKISPGNQSGALDAHLDLGSSEHRWNNLYLSGLVEANGVTTTAVAWESTSNSTSSSKHLRFRNPNGNVGDIRTNGSLTAYVTSSDYRLKENVVVMSGATERLKQLKPSRFNFIADADTTVDGFLAHEVQEIVPEAIAGEKDAMIDEEYEVTPAVLDDDGNVVTEAVMGTRSVPDYQGIDHSKLVPLLVATIQELEARIAQLES